MHSPTIRPVTYAETSNRYRVVTDVDGMGRALMMHCDPGEPSYQRAAASCIALGEGQGDPEQARADFIAALRAAGVFVRE